MTDPRKITERQFQATVKKAAILNGWRTYHTWNSMRSDPGFPDCVLIHAGKKRLIFAELKSDTGKVTEKQQEWLDDLRAVADTIACKQFGVWLEVFVWRPSDMNEIWQILTRP